MKKLTVLVLVLALALSLCACAVTIDPTAAPAEPAATEPAPTETVPVETEPVETEPPVEGVTLNVYSLKGPTSMGLVKLLDDSDNGLTLNTYVSTMCTGADEVTAALVGGKADIALLPANAAATLYNKAGGFSVVGINTLGVLYLVDNGLGIEHVEDLSGKTVVLTGKGTTPEYALRYLLDACGIEDQVTLEFKSEAQEVVAALTEGVADVGLLPQPFVTAALAQNENLRIAVDLNAAWNEVTGDNSIVTGVTVVRNEILEQYPTQIAVFLQEAGASVDFVNENPDQAAPMIEALGIVAKAPIAQKAIPFCNLVCIIGTDMQGQLSSYLQTLYDQNPDAIGGAMPADDFYYTGE